jgi:rhamnosyltransferase
MVLVKDINSFWEYEMDIQAIIVTYHPKIERLTQLCSMLSDSKVGIIIVDNSEESLLDDFFADDTSVIIISLYNNTGIARAQNIGISQALKMGADIIIFFDQDSEIEMHFIPDLLAPVKYSVPFIVAPVFFDAKKGYEYPSFKFNRCGLLRKIYGKERIEPYEVDVVISSGCAATKEVFSTAGLMDEDFFIDFVDIEWVLRCRSKKIPVFVNPKAVMKHSVGNDSIKIGFMRSFIHSPARSYYKLRNAFLFFRKNDISFILGMKEILAALFHQFLQLFYVDKKKIYLKTYLMSIRDGVLGIKGKNITYD